MTDAQSIRPLIGVCSYPNDSDQLMSCVNMRYTACIQQAGGIPVALPYGLEAARIAPEIIDRIDGLLLTGGGDVTEDGFGGNNYLEGCPGSLTYESTERDVFEYAAVRAAWEANLPCLGICRGMQVMNVTFGGTLLRDIAALHPHGTINHFQPDHRNQMVHSVRVEPASWLNQILGGLEFGVNSIHHQAIAEPSPLGRIVAWAPDGTPEALEFGDKHFFIGVQWHPEQMGTQPQLFESFVEAARTCSLQRVH